MACSFCHFSLHNISYRCCYENGCPSYFSSSFPRISSSSPTRTRTGTSRAPHVSSSSANPNFTGLNSGGTDLSFRFQIMSTADRSSITPMDVSKLNQGPDHLLVLVHGIMSSPSDWTYAEAELKRQLRRNFLIYASSSNSFTKTFSGIDGAGRRLADEVLNLVQKTESLKKISFLAHSLGGLFARYAISILYSSETGKLAGLEPVNFITLATPHLGVRGKNQLPFLLGVPILEKLAPSLAPILIGRTGRQLFLTDGKPSKPPLLLRMTSDSEDEKFISSLAAFQSRILYANVSYDHMVGWRTSSIRKENELVKPSRQSLDGYKHIVNVEYCPPVTSEGSHFPPEAAKAKEAVQTVPNSQNTSEYYDIMEGT
ncbi:putative lipase [Iris pallida]|uniref:Lipase n=1 Tax=Iris pallida TaxID=29817 RepID=A0AAX6EB42_IRIPA|nr:putative lipase [Iris pallida]